MWGFGKCNQMGSQVRTQGKGLGRIPFNDMTNT
jgi:hypothetical protein